MTPALSPDSPLAGLDPARLPRHLAIIMDGNGRWARARGWLRLKGHEEGAESVRVVVRACRELGIPVLTLYAFSEENWGRPQDEVGGLMRLLTRFLTTQRPEMVDKGVRLLALGDTGKLPPETREALAATLAATAHCRDLTLCLALSYGGRQEIVRAARLLAEDAAAGRLDPAAMDEAALADRLYTRGLPDPDLLIRTSGEERISNFLLWQLAYAEIYFTQTPWPAFREAELARALRDFAGRQRRYGKTDEQLAGEAG